jgi:hypothetical protein
MGIEASAGARTGRRITQTSYLYHNATEAKGSGRYTHRLRTKLEQSAPESLTQLPSRFVLIHI